MGKYEEIVEGKMKRLINEIASDMAKDAGGFDNAVKNVKHIMLVQLDQERMKEKEKEGVLTDKEDRLYLRQYAEQNNILYFKTDEVAMVDAMEGASVKVIMRMYGANSDVVIDACYSVYVHDWLLDHGYDLASLPEEDCGGEIYVCKREFMDNEMEEMPEYYVNECFYGKYDTSTKN